ncbi:MAG: hypothetical protein AAF633_17245 [Chloroflexota bacterium]
MKLLPKIREEVQAALSSLAIETSSPFVLLTDLNGSILDYYGNRQFLQNGILPLFIASSFAANLEICSYVGEKNKRSNPHLLLEGDTLNIYVALIEHPLMISILFPTKTTVGHVHVNARKICGQVEIWRHLMPQRISETDREKHADDWSNSFIETQKEIDNLFQEEAQKDYLYKL